MSGAEVETDVYLDVHGEQINRAFDSIDKRIADISAHIAIITQRAEAAGKAFGGGLQGSLQKFSKIEGLLTKFEKIVEGPDNAINNRLDVRQAKSAEAALAPTLALGAARARQAEIEGQIAAQVDRTRIARGKDKVQAEQALKVEEARLGVIRARVRELEREAAAQARAASRPPPPPPRTPGGSSGPPGLFGATGLSGIIARTAAYGGAAALIYGTISAVKDGITASIQFQDEIAKIGAVAGLTTTQQEGLAKSIREVAANSRFATNEIAEAAMTLAQAGFSAADIGNSLQQVANLAAAAGVSMSEATDVITSAIGAFQLQTSETGHIADVLAAALNTTKLNIQQVALGIQYAGQTAYENKISFDELTATMATMAQAGIKSGSTMGTGMRLFLTDLQAPTKKLAEEFKKLGISMEDIDVKTRGLPAVLKTLSDKGFSAADAFTALEKRSAAAYLVLKNNQDLLNKQIELQNELGNSAEAAAKGQDSLAAQWQRFKNILNEKVADNFGPITQGIEHLLASFNEAEGNSQIKKMTEDLQRLRDQMPENASAWRDWQEQVQRAEDEINNYKDALKENLDVLSIHADETERAKTKVNEASEAFGQSEQAVKTSTDAIARLIQHQKTLKSDSGALAAETASLMNRFAGLAAQLQGTAMSYDDLLNSMRAVRAEQIKMGAFQAGQQYMGFREAARADFATANSLGQLIVGSGLRNKLPKNILQAIELGRSKADTREGQSALRTIFDFANDPKNGLKGFEADRLRAYSKSLSSGGVNITQSRRASDTQLVYQSLGSQQGQKYLSEVDSLTGKPDSVIQGTIDKFLKLSQAPGYSDAERKTFQQLAQMATGALGSGVAPHPPEGKGHKGRNLGARQDRAEDALALKADAAELKNAIKGLLDIGGSVTDSNGNVVISKSRTLTQAQLEKNIKRVDDGLNKWIEDRTEQVKDQMKQLKIDPNSDRGKAMLADLQQEIDAKREEVQRDVGEKIAKALDIMVDAVERVAKAAEEAADHKLALADARVTALGRQSLNGRVPDYVLANAQRAADRAKDQRDRDQIGINEQRLAGLQSVYNQVSNITDAVGQSNLLAKLDPAHKSLEELNNDIIALRNNTEELKASFEGESMIPQSFNDAWAQAVANFREAHNLTASWGDMIKMNLGGAIETVSGSMEQFLTDVMSGTVSIREAFRNMVKGIIQYLIQLIAKMIVVKLLQIALGMGSGGGASVNIDQGSLVGGNTLAADSLPNFGSFHGGAIGRSGGGRVENGIPSADSVWTRLAKGEYVVRKKAVDSVGMDFMARLNERGANALRSMGPQVVMPPPARQETNVYVVKEGEKPQLGPNDVLLIVNDDLLKGGQTRQLVKHISQGG